MSYSDDAFTLGRRVCTPLPRVFDGAVSGLSAAGALARLRVLAVEQNRLEAERSAVLTRLYELRDDARRAQEESSRRFVDDWDELVAEVGAALGAGRTARRRRCIVGWICGRGAHACSSCSRPGR
ncbi:hypothetical protein [Tsukamurella paurometabola]|nr:hypothetical protein [Tsukamurella paurometabola]UEA85241.1 hypothetical protein LK411_10670 [Tsukamurella paurometabola]